MTDNPASRVVVRVGHSYHWDHLTNLVTPAERVRAETYRHEQGRRDFVAARVLARIVVGELAGAAPSTVNLHQRCQTCRSTEHGRPSATVAGQHVYVSWSRRDGGVAAVAAWNSMGIDIERVGQGPVVHEALSPGESKAVADAADPQLEFLKWWTRKEGLVKVGACTIDDFASIDLTSGQNHWGPWRHRSWHDPDGKFVMSLASAACRPAPEILLTNFQQL